MRRQQLNICWVILLAAVLLLARNVECGISILLSVGELLGSACDADGVCILAADVTLRADRSATVLPATGLRLAGAGGVAVELDLAGQSSLLTVPSNGTLALANLTLAGVLLPTSPYPLPSRVFLNPRAFTLATGARLELAHITILTPSCAALSLHQTYACALSPSPNFTVTPTSLTVHALTTPSLTLSEVTLRCTAPQPAPYPCLAHVVRSGKQLIDTIATYQAPETASAAAAAAAPAATAAAAAATSAAGAAATSADTPSPAHIPPAARATAQQLQPQDPADTTLFIHVPHDISLAEVATPYVGPSGRPSALLVPLTQSLLVIAGPAPPPAAPASPPRSGSFQNDLNGSSRVSSGNASAAGAGCVVSGSGGSLVGGGPEVDLAGLASILPMHRLRGQIRIQDLTLTNLPYGFAEDAPSALLRAAVWTVELGRLALGTLSGRRLVLLRVVLRVPAEEVAIFASDAASVTAPRRARTLLPPPLDGVQCLQENTIVPTVMGQLVPCGGADGSPGLLISHGATLGTIMVFTDVLLTDTPSPVWPQPPAPCGPTALPDPDSYTCSVSSSSSSSDSGSVGSSDGSSGGSSIRGSFDSSDGSSGSSESSSSGDSSKGGRHGVGSGYGLRCECWAAQPSMLAPSSLSFLAASRPLCQMLPPGPLRAGELAPRMRGSRAVWDGLGPQDLTPLLEVLETDASAMQIRTLLPKSLAALQHPKTSPEFDNLISFTHAQANVSWPSVLLGHPAQRTFLDWQGTSAAAINVALPAASLTMRGLVLLNTPPAGLHPTAATSTGDISGGAATSREAAEPGDVTNRTYQSSHGFLWGPGANVDPTQGLPSGLTNFTSCAWFFDFERAAAPLAEEAAFGGSGSAAFDRVAGEWVALRIPGVDSSSNSSSSSGVGGGAWRRPRANLESVTVVVPQTEVEVLARVLAAGYRESGSDLGLDPGSESRSDSGSGPTESMESVFTDPLVAQHAREALLGASQLAGGAAARRWLAQAAGRSGGGGAVRTLTFAVLSWCGVSGVNVTFTSVLPSGSPFPLLPELAALRLPVRLTGSPEPPAAPYGPGYDDAAAARGVPADPGVSAEETDAAAPSEANGASEDRAIAAAGGGGSEGGTPSSSRARTGAIAAGVGGGLALCGLLAFAAVYIIWRRQRPCNVGIGAAASAKQSPCVEQGTPSVSTSASTSALGAGSGFWMREGLRRDLATALQDGLAGAKAEGEQKESGCGAGVGIRVGGAKGSTTGAGGSDSSSVRRWPWLPSMRQRSKSDNGGVGQGSGTYGHYYQTNGGDDGGDCDGHYDASSVLPARSGGCSGDGGRAAHAGSEATAATAAAAAPAMPADGAERGRALRQLPLCDTANADETECVVGGGGGSKGGAAAREDRDSCGRPPLSLANHPASSGALLALHPRGHTPRRLDARRDLTCSSVASLHSAATHSSIYPASTAGGSWGGSRGRRQSELAIGLARLYAAFDRLREGLDGGGAPSPGSPADGASEAVTALAGLVRVNHGSLTPAAAAAALVAAAGAATLADGIAVPAGSGDSGHRGGGGGTEAAAGAAVVAAAGEVGLWGIGGLAVASEIGRGTQGSVVYRGRWRGLDVAVKSCLFAQALGGGYKGGGGSRALQQAALSLWCCHPNLVATYTHTVQLLTLAADGAAAPAAAAPLPLDHNPSQNLSGLDSFITAGFTWDDVDEDGGGGSVLAGGAGGGEGGGARGGGALAQSGLAAARVRQLGQMGLGGRPSILGTESVEVQGISDGAHGAAALCGGGGAGPLRAGALVAAAVPDAPMVPESVVPSPRVEGWRLVLVQEYCDGSSLRSCLVDGTLAAAPPPLLPLLDATTAAHAPGALSLAAHSAEGEVVIVLDGPPGAAAAAAAAEACGAVTQSDPSPCAATHALAGVASVVPAPPSPPPPQPQQLPLPPPLRHALLLALDVARGMAHLHKCGIVHGDLSSSNVLLVRWAPRPPPPPQPLLPPPRPSTSQQVALDQRGTAGAAAGGPPYGDAPATYDGEVTSYRSNCEEEGAAWELTLCTEEEEEGVADPREVVVAEAVGSGAGAGGSASQTVAAAAEAAVAEAAASGSNSGGGGRGAGARDWAPASGGAGLWSWGVSVHGGGAHAPRRLGLTPQHSTASPPGGDHARTVGGNGGGGEEVDGWTGGMAVPVLRAPSAAALVAPSQPRLPPPPPLPQWQPLEFDPSTCDVSTLTNTGTMSPLTAAAAAAHRPFGYTSRRQRPLTPDGSGGISKAVRRPGAGAGTHSRAAAGAAPLAAGAAALGGRSCGGGGDARRGWSVSAGGELLVTSPSAADVEADRLREAAGLGYVAKVCDFGLAGRLAEPDQTHLSGATRHCSLYTAPELARDGVSGRATDAYAFALVLWELAAGRPLPEALAAEPPLREWLRQTVERPLLLALSRQRHSSQGTQQRQGLGGAGLGAGADCSQQQARQQHADPAAEQRVELGMGGDADSSVPLALPPALLPWPASPPPPAEVVALVAACLAELPAERPAFTDIAARLEGLLRAGVA